MLVHGIRRNYHDDSGIYPRTQLRRSQFRIVYDICSRDASYAGCGKYNDDASFKKQVMGEAKLFSLLPKADYSSQNVNNGGDHNERNSKGIRKRKS